MDNKIFSSFRVNNGEAVRFTDAVTYGGVTAKISDSGNGYLHRRLALSNEADVNSEQITEPYTLDAFFDCQSEAKFHSIRGDDCSDKSFLPIDRSLFVGEALTLAPTGGRSSDDTAFPFFDLCIDGKPYLIAVGWAGQWKCVIERDENTVHITVGLENADFYIKPGETLMLPSVCLTEGVHGEDSAAVRRRFRRMLMTDMSPLPRDMTHTPISIQPFDLYFYRNPYWATEEGQLKTLEGAKKVGNFDTFWIDAAWFKDGFPNGVGNYSFHNGFPNGFRRISDAVHREGMKFMVWFEPERIHIGSDVYKEHPEFLLSSKGNADNHLFYLGNEAAYGWLCDTLVSFIGENGIDIYRQDFNFRPLDYWRENDENNRVGITEIKHINGLYRLWDELRERFPGLIIDNCASGGRRIDLETVRRAVPLWRSDVACSPVTPEKHRDVWNHNHTLALSEYLPYHSAAAWQLDTSIVRSAATMGLACTFDVLNPDYDFETASAAVLEVKHLSAYWDGDFYPITAPTLDEDGFAAWQLSKENCGCVTVFRRAECKEDKLTLKLAGIDRSAEYNVTVTDENRVSTVYSVSGAELADGYDVFLPESHTSAVIEYSVR